MSEQEHEPPWQVHSSGLINSEIRKLQRRAVREGRGEQMLTALRHIAQLLHRDPTTFGEPLFRLPALRMQVRTVVIRPLAFNFAGKRSDSRHGSRMSLASDANFHCFNQP